MKPLLKIKANEYVEIQQAIEERELMQKSQQWDYDFDVFMQSVKTAKMFEEWMDETSEKVLFEKYKITPGELHRRLYSVNWLAYSAKEMARIIGKKEHISELINLRMRLKYGVRKELIPLVRLKGIGRVRARKLFRNGIKNALGIRKAPKERLAGLLGKKTAEMVVEQVKANQKHL